MDWGAGSRWPQLEAEKSRLQSHTQSTERKLEVGKAIYTQSTPQWCMSLARLHLLKL